MSRRTISFIFLFGVTVLPTLIFAWLGYSYGNRELGKFILDRVQSVNQLKAEKVASFFDEAVAETNLLAENKILQEHMSALVASSNDTGSQTYKNAHAALDLQLPDLRLVHEYEDIKLLSQRGVIVYVANTATHASIGTAAENELLEAFREGQKGIKIGSMFYDDKSAVTSPHYSVNISRNVVGADGLPVGVVVIEISLTKLMDQIMESTGLSTTGETYIARDDGTGMLFLSPLRQNPNATLTLSLSYNDEKEKGLQEATQGKSGRGEVRDYAGTKVLAAWQQIPGVNWGMSTKIHSSEAFAHVWRIRNFLILMSIAALVIVTPLIVLVISMLFIRPLRKLGDVASAIDRGEEHVAIDHGLLYSHDVFGRIATHLHNISEKIKHGHQPTKNNDLIEHDHQDDENERKGSSHAS